MSLIRVMAVIGTRPEIIKMAPVILELKKRSDRFTVSVVLTGQHREMAEPYLRLFDIKPDYDLAIMEQNQTLNSIVANTLRELTELLKRENPDIVLVQGDTSSAFAAALAAFHNKCAVGHIEAGLRTRDKYNPFPEEMNRRLISSLANLHFPPTVPARENLLLEGIPEEQIVVTGNTSIDALMLTVKNADTFNLNDAVNCYTNTDKRIICVTAHRRESFGEPLECIAKALVKIVELFPDVLIVFPVHYNPNVRKLVYDRLGNTDRICLIDPLSYEQFVCLMSKAYLILTDSGGIQEEAPSLDKPVLILRENTERLEGVQAGTARLVGTNIENIVRNVSDLLSNPISYDKMAHAVNPFGDGKASLRIVDTIQEKILSKGK